MGLMGDNFEANRDRAGDLWWRRYGRDLHGVPPPHPTPHHCPVCAQSFVSRTELADHVFTIHRGLYFYIQINGEVCPVHPVRVHKPIEELFVGYRDPPAAVIDIWVEDAGGRTTEATRRARMGGVVLQDLLPPEPRRIRVQFRGSVLPAVTIEVEPPTSIPPDLGPVEADVRVLQQELIDRPGSVDWNRWERRLRRPGLNPSQQRYAAGFLEYLSAYEQETQAPEPGGALGGAAPDLSARGFGLAWNRLRAFDTPLAATICRVISFKFNWFEHLRQVHPSSVFHYPGQFYLLSYAEVVGLQENEAPVPAFGGDWQVLADDFTERLLAALHAFRRADRRAMDDLLSRLVEDPLAATPPNQEKLTLVRARWHRQQGRGDAARQMYVALRDHHQFGKEAEELG